MPYNVSANQITFYKDKIKALEKKLEEKDE